MSEGLIDFIVAARGSKNDDRDATPKEKGRKKEEGRREKTQTTNYDHAT